MTTNTRRTTTTWLPWVLLAVILAGCSKTSDRLDQGWTQPIAVAGSNNGLAGWFILHECADALIGVKPLRDGAAQLLILNRAKNSWSAVPVAGVPSWYIWGAAAIDPQNKRMLLPKGYVENEELVMNALMATIAERAGLQDVTQTKWVTDKTTLLGETGPNVKLSELERGQKDVDLGPGILNGSEACIPYCLNAAEVTHEGQTLVVDQTKGPFSSGMFHSTDSGKTWQLEKVSDLNGRAPAICKTVRYFYYFGTYPLWSSRKPAEGDKWDEPKTIIKTLGRVLARYAVAGGNDTVHVCWEDRRHDKWRFNPTGPRIENCDIYYRRRKDTDQEWSKEVLLSKGLLYCYAPTISAEGDNVVVVWAGIRTADRQHTYMGPNDIYYVTSKDAGKTWTSPLRVTDGAKAGITAGWPQVALLNGVIHLLYTQGAQRTPTELSPGLRKLGEGSWPIYYQRRDFSN